MKTYFLYCFIKKWFHILVYHFKVLQPKKTTTTYGLNTISYTGAKLWNDLFPILSNNVELDVLKASLNILKTNNLYPTFTYA